MPYLKALVISELQNDIEVYRYINSQDLQFKNEITENFLNGLRGGMNELFTDFKKQFEKLKSNAKKSEEDNVLDFGDEDSGNTMMENYQVSIMYDKYFVRKKEISENILMIVICDTDVDGHTGNDDNDLDVCTSSFNLGQIDLLFQDYKSDFQTISTTINQISKNISQTM